MDKTYLHKKEFCLYLQSLDYQEMGFVLTHILGEYQFQKLVAGYYAYKHIMLGKHFLEVHRSVPEDYQLHETVISNKKKKIDKIDTADWHLFKKLLWRQIKPVKQVIKRSKLINSDPLFDTAITNK